MKLERIESPQAPAAIGPYSQAVRAGNFLFLSGQIPLDPASGQIVGADVTAQATRVLENIKAILAAAGAGFDRVVRSEVYLKDLNDFAKMNEVYSKYFAGPVLPARQTFQVAKLPKDALVEIVCIACLE